MKHQSVLLSLFKGVIVNGLNWLRALESMVMKKVKIRFLLHQGLWNQNFIKT